MEDCALLVHEQVFCDLLLVAQASSQRPDNGKTGFVGGVAQLAWPDVG